MLTDVIVRGTARVFVACYVCRILVDLAGRRDPVSQRFARWCWTIGCIFFFVHMAAAFHGLHGWSSAAAYDHVLKRTQEATGIATGVGLYVNYAFAALWLADTVLWWRRLNWSDRRVPYWVTQATFGFMMVQATVVFGPPFWTPVAVALAVAAFVIRSRHRNRHH